MVPIMRWAAALVMLGTALATAAQDAKYSIKPDKSPPPKELNPAIQKLLQPESIKFLAPDGKTIAELWFRKQVPAEATAEQIKNGLTYRELKQSEILGAIRFDQDWADYRKNKVKAGVYTLRLAFQPQDGDHTGASMYQDFLVVIDAAKDEKAGLLDAKEMIELSAKSINLGHPGVFMLFPNNKPGDTVLAPKANNHWVLNTKEEVLVGGKSAGSLGIGLALVGAAEN
jgi:hypothetical protein